MEKVWREELYKMISIYPQQSSQVLIAKAIISRLNQGKSLNITEIAKETYNSKPTVTRFAQSLGFNGMKDFAKAIAVQDELYLFRYEVKPYIQSYQDYIFTLNTLINEFFDQFETLTKIVSLIANKRKLYIFSSPENTSIANNFANKMNFIGIKTYCAETHQLFLLNSIEKDDIALFLVSGLDNETLLKMWNELAEKVYRFLIVSQSQSLKFLNPTYLLKVNVYGNLLREQFKQFMFVYILDQMYNLLVYSDKYFSHGIDQNIFVTLN